MQGDPWQFFNDKLEHQFTDASIAAYVLFHGTHVGAQLFDGMTELGQAERLALHVYHDSNHVKLDRRDALGKGFLVVLFSREGEVDAKSVEYASTQLGGDGCRSGQPFFHGLSCGRDFAGGKLLNKIDSRSQPMKVTPTSTAPIKRIAKPIVAKHLRLDFADKGGPRAGNSLQAFCYVSDGQFGDESVDYIPAGVNATPSWTRWSNVSVK